MQQTSTSTENVYLNERSVSQSCTEFGSIVGIAWGKKENWCALECTAGCI